MNYKTITKLLLATLLTLAMVMVVSAEPTQPTSITNITNSTIGGQSGMPNTQVRGYIHYVQIDESALSTKWKAYVGNVTGEFALQDASGNAIYDWTITTVSGELYATKEASSGGSGIYDGGTPTWTNLTCADSTLITDEEGQFNHTVSDEDSYSNTFKNSDYFNLSTFYAGERSVNDSSIFAGAGGDCYGIYLNTNNADQYTDWEEVVLTDGTYSDEGGSNYDWDVVYAALLENNANGFDNIPYDFQILLPESGLNGTQPAVTYYFYVELN